MMSRSYHWKRIEKNFEKVQENSNLNIGQPLQMQGKSQKLKRFYQFMVTKAKFGP